MENSFQTSFIPKKPTTTSGTASVASKRTSISMVVAIFILVVVVLSTVGLYLYKNYYLLKQKETLSANLFKIRDSFDKDTIANLESYDKHSTVAKQLLTSHVVLTPLFQLINELTLTSIQYTKFDHRTVGNIFSVKMSGIARDYKSIALQADVFNTKQGAMFKDVIFSNITKDKNNYVTFDIEFNVDPALLSFSNNIVSKQSQPAVNTTSTIVPTPTESPVTQTVVNDSTTPPTTTKPTTTTPTTPSQTTTTTPTTTSGSDKLSNTITTQ